jgi:hypothetical protein
VLQFRASKLVPSQLQALEFVALRQILK